VISGRAENLFLIVFVRNDPVNSTDPTGLCTNPTGFTGSAFYGCLFYSSEMQSAEAAYAASLPWGGSVAPTPFVASVAIGIGGSVICAGSGVCLGGAIIVGGAIAIYAGYQLGTAIASAIQSRGITARDAASVNYPPDARGKDANGKCNPTDPQKYVKWRGSDAAHWHYIDWNQNTSTCVAYPVFMTGPDPGPKWREIPR